MAIQRPRLSIGRRSNTEGRPSGSSRVTISPSGLWYISTRDSRCSANLSGITLPLCLTRSPGPIFCPSEAGKPLTEIRPAITHSSISRREPMPICASTFCRRSGSAKEAGLSCGSVPGRGGRARGGPSRLNEPSADLCASGRMAGLPDGAAPSGLLLFFVGGRSGLRDFLGFDKIHHPFYFDEWRQLREAAQAKIVEKTPGRCEQRRPARSVTVADHV